MKVLKFTQKVPVFKALLYTGDNMKDVKEFSNRNIEMIGDRLKIIGSQGFMVKIGEYVIKSPDNTIFICSKLQILEYFDPYPE